MHGAVLDKSTSFWSANPKIGCVGRRARYLRQNSNKILRSRMASAFLRPTSRCQILLATIWLIQFLRLSALISPWYMVPGVLRNCVIGIGMDKLYLTITLLTSRSDVDCWHRAKSESPGLFLADTSPISATTPFACLMAARHDVASAGTHWNCTICKRTMFHALLEHACKLLVNLCFPKTKCSWTAHGWQNKLF